LNRVLVGADAGTNALVVSIASDTSADAVGAIAFNVALDSHSAKIDSGEAVGVIAKLEVGPLLGERPVDVAVDVLDRAKGLVECTAGH
jgi:hypothetical protein